jgi:hypothetical protein
VGWDGAGGYTRQHNFSADASAGIKILALRMDQEFNDVASAITLAWARNGQNVPTQAVPMGGQRFINVGAATSVGNYARVKEIIENIPIFMQDVETSADRISVSAQYFTSVSANQAPGDGTRVIVRANSNKSSAVLYLNGHSANVEYQDGNRAGPALVSGGLYEFLFSSADTAWKIQNPDDGRTAKEVTAGVTPTNFQIENLPIIDLRRYGLDVNATGATNRAALEAAIDVAGALGGATLQAPSGTFVIDATVAFDTDNVFLRGVGRGTIWQFDPSVADVLFDFDEGANSVWFCGVSDCQFYSTNSTTKTAIRVDDGRDFRAKNITISQGNWPGSASIGIQAAGRELVKIIEPQILCARPILLGVNPNHATLHTDFFVVEDGILGSTETTGTAIEIADGVNISNLAINRIAFVLGKWCVKWIDTTSTIDSYALGITSCRTEQATDSAGFSFEFNSTAQDIKQLFIEKCYFDPGRGGLKLRKAEDVTVKSCSFTGGAGVTNLDVTFQSATQLRLENTFVQVASTVTLTSGILESAGIFNTAETVIPKTVTYVYDQGAVASQKPAFKHNSLKTWSYTGTLANNGTLNTPILRASYTHAIVKVSAYSATGPIHCGGSAVWTKDGTTTKIGGSANFVVAAVGVELRCLDGGSGLVIVNVLGQDVSLAIDVEFV